MGTPDFSVPCLQALIDDGHDVCAVFTQPDKPKGRHGVLTPPPVKELALKYDIPVYQPKTLKTDEAKELFKSLNADLAIVVAYGKILPGEFIHAPKYGCINMHASLLPKLRGAAPIQWSIITGEKRTGVTSMQMDEGLDTGDMIDKVEVAITPEDTGATLHDKLAEAGAALILETLTKLENHTATRTKQDDAQSCYASMLSKEMGRMDFAKSAEELERLIRGLNPWPCAYTEIDGKNVKIYKAKVIAMDDAYKTQAQGKVEQTLTFAPGEIVEVAKKYFVIACGTDALQIQNLQPEGKKPMDTVAYLNGNPLKAGMTVNWK